MVPGGRPGTQRNLLVPSGICAERNRLGKRSRLIGDESAVLFSLALRAHSVLQALPTVDGVGTGGTRGIIENGRLDSSIEPHSLGGRGGGEEESDKTV